MKIDHTTISVADYLQFLKRNEISVNKAYQRSDKVWPSAARSFLVETVLLDYPIPKLSLHQILDVQSATTVKEVVDGQQRTAALRDFFENKYRLSPKSRDIPDAAGCKFEDLDEDLKTRFLTYSLNFDVFVNATSEDVREVFRRMNSFTVPLNPEEQRHAVYQGSFKWFIRQLAKDFGTALISMGVFRMPQVMRMADAKLFTEIAHAVLFGVSTTNRSKLDALYRQFDIEFPAEQDLDNKIRSALDAVIRIPEIHKSAIMKPYALYSLLLAAIHHDAPLPHLVDRLGQDHNLVELTALVNNLVSLADALESGEATGPFRDFVLACSGGTNVKDKRLIRIDWFYRAITSDAFPD